MKNNKTKTLLSIELFTLDFTDALLPKSWPSDVPLVLKLQTGQHQKSYDIVVSDEPWYESLLKFVDKQQYTVKDKNLPIGVSANNMYVGAKIYDEYRNVVAEGKGKDIHAKEIEQKKEALEKVLIPLREKFPGIKDKFLEDFNETQQSLLKACRPLENAAFAYDVFCDIFTSGNGSSYSDGSIASLGAYNSVIDFNTLKCTIDLFDKNDLNLISQESERIAYLTPIHGVINGQIKAKNATYENAFKPKMK